MNIRRLIFAVLGIFVITLPITITAQDPPYRVVGYYTSYSIYDPQRYFVTDIPTGSLTHLIYAHVDISNNGQCVSSDEWADMEYPYPGDRDNERLRGNFKQLALVKEDNPDLEIMMSIGGWDFSRNFSDVAADEDSRVRFVRSCIAFMREYGFDGIDLDWRFPVTGGQYGGGSPADAENYRLLLADFRGQFDYWEERDGSIYLLSMALPGGPDVNSVLPLDEMQVFVDWFNVMTYSYQGEWSDLASHHAPLYSSSRDPRGGGAAELFTVSGSVDTLLDAGVIADKIVVGVPFFAHSWRNVRPNDFFGLYSENDGAPNGTRPGGILYYSDLASFISSPNYVRFFDSEAGVPWMYNEEGRIAISYENAESIGNKAAYVRRSGLGGIMIWELSFDDAQHTLLDAVYSALLR